MYYFLDWIKSQDDEGFEPSLPENIGFALVLATIKTFMIDGEYLNALPKNIMHQKIKRLANL